MAASYPRPQDQWFRHPFVLLGLGLIACPALAVSLHVPGSLWVGTLARKDTVVALMLVSAALYAAAVWLVTSRPLPRHSLIWIIAVAAIMRIILLCSPPFMSSDVYRYVWDGRVQQAGINPYAYVPADAALRRLRDPAIYENINRKEYAHTIYPPAAQMLFAAVARLSQTVIAMKIALVLLEAAGIAAMLRLLAIAKLPASRILIYAWNPLAAWAVAGDGHIDGAAIGLLGLAMLAWATRRDGLAGMLLGGAILTKFLPVVAAPALWRRWGWKLPAACAVTIAVLYACYAGVGWRVFGFLPNYTAEEGLRQGSGFWLLALLERATPLPHFATALYLLVSAVCLGALAWRVTRMRHPDTIEMAGNVALLAAATVAAMSPHYPWYYAWLALPCCLRVWPSVVWLSVAPLVLYSDPFHDEILIPTAVFVPAAVLAVRDVGVRKHFFFEKKKQKTFSFSHPPAPPYA
jgi:hypothetical protein